MVGDPKQSIYRFRRADIAVYELVRDGALAGGFERISTNFRSNREMLSALNATFDDVLSARARTAARQRAAREPAGRAAVAAAAGRGDRGRRGGQAPTSCARARRERSPRCCNASTTSAGRSATGAPVCGGSASGVT